MSNPKGVKTDRVPAKAKNIFKDVVMKKEKQEKQYVMVRGDRSGVFCGYLEQKEGREIVLSNARRIWYWEGAASLSQLAQSGTSKPEGCKFPEPVDQIKILDTIEILSVSPIAKKSIEGVAVWKK